MAGLSLHLDPESASSLGDLVEPLVRRRFLREQGDEDSARRAAVAWTEGIAPRARRLVVDLDGEERGEVWVAAQGDDLSVVTAHVEERLAAGVRDRLLDLARAEGARRLTAGLTPGDAVLAALTTGAGFEPVAFQMCLGLHQDLPGEQRVALEPMDTAQYAAWEADEIESYALAREKSGETRETALRISREQHAELLPDALATEGHHFFVGRLPGSGGTSIGTLWLGTERPMVFVYDVVVDEDQRRRGYGAGLMRAAALWSQAHGSHALGLNVFGYNHGAKALYDTLGFEVVETFLACPVDQPEP